MRLQAIRRRKRSARAGCLFCGAALVSAWASGAQPPPTVSHAWIRFIMPSLPAAGYFRLSNPGGQPRVLVGADSAACGSLMLHQSVSNDGMDHMMMLASVRVPAHGHVDFTPGSYHLMCLSPAKSMGVGSRVSVTLHFADGAAVTASFAVRGATG